VPEPFDTTTAEERDRLEADLAYWQELADAIDGWSLMGFTWRQSATYVTPGQRHTKHTDVLNLTWVQRDGILAAIEAALHTEVVDD
jgi:hypothetical protein